MYLETFAVFLLAFLGLQLLMVGVMEWIGHGSTEGMEWMIALQWLVLPAMLWGLVRRVGWKRFSVDMGLHRGEGVLKEMGAGIVGYLAGLPVFLLAGLVTVVLVLLRELLTEAAGGEAPKPQVNEVLEMLTSENVWVTVMLFGLMTVWAPLVEEGVMRGALYRHIRSRMGMVGAALVTAALFGLLHQYEVMMMLPVIALGFNFALMREWRGSLIAPMTAHALHNGTIGVVVITLFRLMG